MFTTSRPPLLSLFVALSMLVQAASGCDPESPNRNRRADPSGVLRVVDAGHGLADGEMLVTEAGPSLPPPIQPSEGCGNGKLDSGEVCDGDTKSCAEIDAEEYVDGAAPCNASCSGYDLGSCVVKPPPPKLDDAIATITEVQLKQDLVTIASDEYNGRYPGSQGDKKTQDYISKGLSSAGVAPGKNGGYLQTFSWNGIQTANVVGVLAGTDSSLKDEVVIIGGHHDHLGTSSDYGCADKGGNSICNGADDNGTGAVAVLAVARAMGKLKGQNRRTIVFIAFGAEEKGLAGSSYYVKQDPLYPLSKTVYMINIDMIGYSTGGVSALGAGKSQLASQWINDAAGKHSISASVTSSAGSGSDHYHFALAQVPYVFFHTGLPYCYHATCDTVEKIHFKEYTQITKAMARLVWKISQADTSPRSDFSASYSYVEDPAVDWKTFQDLYDHKLPLEMPMPGSWML